MPRLPATIGRDARCAFAPLCAAYIRAVSRILVARFVVILPDPEADYDLRNSRDSRLSSIDLFFPESALHFSGGGGHAHFRSSFVGLFLLMTLLRSSRPWMPDVLFPYSLSFKNKLSMMMNYFPCPTALTRLRSSLVSLFRRTEVDRG